jgi:hypothetical protein
MRPSFLQGAFRAMLKAMGRVDPVALRSIHKGRWLRLHPLSGVAILLLDNIFFGVKMATVGIGLPVTATLAFWTTLFSVWFIQRKLVGEDRRMCFMKALAAGVIAGIPTSIAGTFLATWVLVSSGLHPLRRRLKLH